MQADDLAQLGPSYAESARYQPPLSSLGCGRSCERPGPLSRHPNAPSIRQFEREPGFCDLDITYPGWPSTTEGLGQDDAQKEHAPG